MKVIYQGKLESIGSLDPAEGQADEQRRHRRHHGAEGQVLEDAQETQRIRVERRQDLAQGWEFQYLRA